jgi:predicted DNA-binding transcriptional regulator YafY
MSPRLAAELPRYFGEAAAGILAGAEPAGADGWLRLCLPFETFESARERILGFGGAVEVLAPEALRRSVADFAAQTCAVYAQEGKN